MNNFYLVGSGSVTRNSESYSLALKRKVELIRELPWALAAGQFFIVYQPQNSGVDGALIGAEALLRWQSPRKGLVSPVEFIPISEQTGFIIELTEWLFRESFSVAALWPQPIALSVNLSNLHLGNPGRLRHAIVKTLNDTGLAPNRLVLERTESVFLLDESHLAPFFGELRGMGIKIALDDFGTGYSSLLLLQNIPFDEKKIDQSFS